jgi:hypothetical protein
MYKVVVTLTVAMHFAFILYFIVGGFIAVRWPRSIWVHVPAVLWGNAITIGHLDCPLTWLERWARAKAGMAPLPPQGFIAHYITGVLFPVSWVGAAQIVVFAMVAMSWVLYVRRCRCRNAAAPVGE